MAFFQLMFFISLPIQDPGPSKELNLCIRAYDLSYTFAHENGKLANWNTVLTHKYKSKTKSIQDHIKTFMSESNDFVVKINPNVIGKKWDLVPKSQILLKLFRKNGEYLLCTYTNGFDDGPFIRESSTYRKAPSR